MVVTASILGLFWTDKCANLITMCEDHDDDLYQTKGVLRRHL